MSEHLYLIKVLLKHLFYGIAVWFLDTATKGILFLVDKIKKKK